MGSRTRPVEAAVRQLGRALRSLSPVAAIAVLVVVALGGLGIADAATGGSFILGRSNHETSTATLANSRGTPLSLSAPRNHAPLAVNRSTEVKNLNAQYVGGLSASAIKPTGGDDVSQAGSKLPLAPVASTEVAGTGKLTAGTYYVTASAEINLATGDSAGGCVVTLNNNVNHPLQQGDESGGPVVTVAETLAVKVPKNGKLEEYCGVTGSASGSAVQSSGLTAIKILASSGSSQ